MPKLRYKGQWFLQIAPDALPEQAFESLLIQHSDAFVPDAWMIPFKKTIYSRDGSAQADLAIVSHDYRQWFVVEVEMSRHSLFGHVLPQVRTLRDGDYGEDHADYLIERQAELDPARTKDLLRSSPKVLVIADRPDPDWRRTLAGADISLFAIEIYKSELNEYIFSLDGAVPSRPADLVTYCSFSRMLPRQLTVETPSALQIANGEHVQILWEGRITEWIRMDIKDRCYLRTRGPFLLKPGVRYALMRNSDGAFFWKS